MSGLSMKGEPGTTRSGRRYQPEQEASLGHLPGMPPPPRARGRVASSLRTPRSTSEGVAADLSPPAVALPPPPPRARSQHTDGHSDSTFGTPR